MAMANIDPFIAHAFDIEAANARRTGPEANYLFYPEIRISLLIQVKNSDWRPSKELDIQISSRIGSIIACQASRSAIEALSHDPSVITVEADRPGSGFDTQQSLPFTVADLIHKDPNLTETGNESLIAIIDSGIDVLHKAFRDADGNTRIIALWDQSNLYGPGNARMKASYGDVYRQVDIDSFIQSNSVPPELGRDRSGHGTHVASIAAGRAVGNFSGGIAPEAQIIFVKSPPRSYGSSTGYKKTHSDALEFIDALATKLHKPVVVNLSQGMNAGAHDGTTLVEVAFDEFTRGGREPGRVVVKSAGNERRSDCHAEIYVNTGGRSVLEWEVVSDHESTVIELWFPSHDKLQFRLVNPDNEESGWASWSNPTVDEVFRNGNHYRMTYTRFNADNGDSLLLLSIDTGTTNLIRKSNITWKLEIDGLDVKTNGLIHAWMERDMSLPAKFRNSWLSENVTISIPGTARTVITVGAINPSKPYTLADFSSVGPTRDKRAKPDLVAPGNNIYAARAGTLDDVRMEGGTSMAAPHVSGAIALLFSYIVKHRPGDTQLNAAQVRAALIQSTSNFNGQHYPTIGFGVLDIKRLLELFD
jgi:subtilisin family serine protease